MTNKEIYVLIPSLNPNNKLIDIVKELKANDLNNICVIDDGSKEESSEVFSELESNYGVKVLKNEVNMGKGISLKKGIEFIKNQNGINGIITMDCDGQHRVVDTVKIAKKMSNGKIVLGVRDFNRKNVPLRSKVGNKFSSLYMKLLTGVYVKDTQTGLRGISREFFDLAIETEGNRFEYEMNFLYAAVKRKDIIDYVDINTVYEDNVSNFRTIRDSYLIYKGFIKNAIVALISFIIDVVVFYLLSKVLFAFYANTIARIVSGICDFVFNKRFVFNSKGGIKKEALSYFVLYIINLVINGVAIMLLSFITDKLLLFKILVNFVLFIVNFIVKKNYIFNEQQRKGRL